jgi:hypothetical protein
MKLYYEHTQGGYWELPGQQSKSASRVDIPSTPVALCAWLNERRVPLNMPLHQPEPEPAPIPAAPRLISYTEQSVSWDELFPKLPIAHQLHFAAMAMENAREALP